MATITILPVSCDFDEIDSLSRWRKTAWVRPALKAHASNEHVGQGTLRGSVLRKDVNWTEVQRGECWPSARRLRVRSRFAEQSVAFGAGTSTLLLSSAAVCGSSLERQPVALIATTCGGSTWRRELYQPVLAS